MRVLQAEHEIVGHGEVENAVIEQMLIGDAIVTAGFLRADLGRIGREWRVPLLVQAPGGGDRRQFSSIRTLVRRYAKVRLTFRLLFKEYLVVIQVPRIPNHAPLPAKYGNRSPSSGQPSVFGVFNQRM